MKLKNIKDEKTIHSLYDLLYHGNISFKLLTTRTPKFEITKYSLMDVKRG
jgi:hypothetical protein